MKSCFPSLKKSPFWSNNNNEIYYLSRAEGTYNEFSLNKIKNTAYNSTPEVLFTFRNDIAGLKDIRVGLDINRSEFVVSEGRYFFRGKFPEGENRFIEPDRIKLPEKLLGNLYLEPKSQNTNCAIDLFGI